MTHIKRKYRWIPFVLFSVIFIIYFCSAAGLHDSLDAPQFFTTEALLLHGNLNLLPFQTDPHFFVHPDFFVYNDQMLGLRGYLQSIISIPLSLVAYAISPLFITSQFPFSIQTPHFAYELATTSFFSLFSVLGLVFVWKLMRDLVKNEIIPSIVISAVALGSYFWKYSTMYARQPIMVALIGMILYGLFLCFKKKTHRGLLLASMGWGLAYGIDTTLFIAATIALFIYGAGIPKKKRFFIEQSSALLPGVFILTMNILGNLWWYGTISFAQYDRHFLFASIPPDQLQGFLLSVPLFPTLWYVLFSIGRLDPAIFSYIDKYPEVAFIFSAEYAKKYIFYGLFAISSFFWPIILFMRSFIKAQERRFFLTCGVFFTVGIVLNTKWFAFYAANQYDVRYFYPFILCLAPLLAVALKSAQGKGWKTMVFNTLFIASIIWSVYMGWLGQLSMLQPALTGERKVWVDVNDGFTVFQQYSSQELIHYSFMNAQNIGIALIFVCLCGLLFLRNNKNIH